MPCVLSHDYSEVLLHAGLLSVLRLLSQIRMRKTSEAELISMSLCASRACYSCFAGHRDSSADGAADTLAGEGPCLVADRAADEAC